MRTWMYKGNQSGFKTQVQRCGADLVFFQTRDGALPFLPDNCVAVRFNEKDLLKAIKASRKPKRGKKHAR